MPGSIYNEGDRVWTNRPGDSPLQIEVTEAGRNTISFYVREDGIQLDKIILDTSSSKPTGMGATESDYIKPDSDVPVTGVAICRNSLTLRINETVELTAILFPANATNRDVTWESDNPEVATIDNTGLLSAKTGGTTHIIATSTDGKFQDTVTVTVEFIPASGVEIVIKIL